MPVRHFNSTSDVIKFAVGAGDITAAVTIAVLLRPTVAKSLDGIYEAIKEGGALGGYGFFMTAAGKLVLEADDGSEEKTSTDNADEMANEKWILAVVTKASGKVKPTFYTLNFKNSPASWVVAEGSTAIPNPTSIAGGSFDVGGGADGPYFFGGDVAAVGRWDRVLSESEAKSLAVTLGSWGALEPKVRLAFNQGSVEEAVNDLTGNGADQTSRTGTTVVAEEPPVPYSGTGYVAEAEQTYAARTALSVPKPSAVGKGDVMLMTCYLELTGVAMASEGWTLIGTRREQGSSYQVSQFYKIDDGTAGPYAVTWNGTSHGCEALIEAYRGCDQSNPINANSASINASSKTLKCLSATTTKPNCRIVQIGVESVAQAATQATGFLERHDNTSADGIHVADALQVAEGASGEKNFTLGTSATSIGFLIALAPVADSSLRMLI